MRIIQKKWEIARLITLDIDFFSKKTTIENLSCSDIWLFVLSGTFLSLDFTNMFASSDQFLSDPHLISQAVRQAEVVYPYTDTLPTPQVADVIRSRVAQAIARGTDISWFAESARAAGSTTYARMVDGVRFSIVINGAGELGRSTLSIGTDFKKDPWY